MAQDRITVLHVDDEEDILDITHEFLALDGIESRTTTDPMLARRLLDEEEFDVLISDYQMPTMDGLVLLNSLRKDGISIPFILFTGKGREDVAIHALNSGADFYLQKGGDPRSQFAELSNMVRACSERTRQRRLITRFTDIVKNVQSALMAFHLDPESGRLMLNMANPRADKLIKALHGKKDQDLDGVVPGLFSEAEKERLLELASGDGPPLKAVWDGVLGGKTRFLQIVSFSLPGTMVGVIVNEITAIAMAEQRMAWAEEKYRSFFHSGYLPMVVADNENKLIVEVNDRFCDFYGYRREEIIGQPLIAISAEPEATLETLERVRQIGLKVVHTRYHRRKDGGLMPVQTIYGRMVSEGREMVTGIVLDISERLESESKLRTLSKAVENSPVTIMITDPRGLIEYVNPKFTSLTGYALDEVRGRKPGLLSSDRNRRELYDELWNAILAGRTWKGEFANRKKNGETYWESASISPILDPNGNVEHYVAVKEDITEAKFLADQNAHLSEMVTRAVNEIYSFYPDTLRFEFVNRSALDNLGYTMEEMRSMDPLDLKKDISHDRFHDLLERLRSGKEAVVQFETTHLRRDGTKYPVEVHLQLVGEEGEKRFLAIIIDITYRKRMQEDLERLSEKAKVLGALTRHDIGNQMSVLLGNLEMMAMRNGTGDRHTQAATKAAHRIQQYLEFSETFDRAGSVSPEWQDLGETIAGSWAGTGNESVEVVSNIPPLQVLADTMFPKVFDNLFANSLRHAGGMSRISIDWREDGGAGRIIYRDDGPGIPDHVRPILFSKPYEGTKGLGLFLIREVLKATGMDIEECGKAGDGVCFVISVPAPNWRW